MLGSEEGWSIVASFCEAVMALREASEREREQAANALPICRRNTGHRRTRRRRYAHLMPPFRALGDRDPLTPQLQRRRFA
ncbi:jg18727 [Pararge aegeria aegeria]|uniref:Jg18727 protein n=1 Tax=Pararge aegeria aegeria TaxID=348720 RepID=A0A8S4RJ65_9NEOP|nr:jg18727 [Pararge aegeria aegeria]